MAKTSFWDNFSSGVSNFFNVGSTISSDSNMFGDDVIKTKSALNAVGKYDVPDFGITDIPDMNMIDGLKSFQSDNGLKVDGVMKPDGPTQNALSQALENQSISTTDLLESAKSVPFHPNATKPSKDAPQAFWSASNPVAQAKKPKSQSQFRRQKLIL
ncbi:peptidoglycan-binding domain-containing protein [Terasakiella sp. A23]|uniref:peptidoglycan-binding domain-containing protein n=1 Tax=Terasakiella sp. FCG-A23 TaxID=3080561 RepID=UPI002952A119|nr:peptidoglycan-binding domain-containing protein [Terasakiella sp. A23]MDV7341731.1 peptidoglycan-binding domain-containing protein [Terasakiella sp. A23]